MGGEKAERRYYIGGEGGEYYILEVNGEAVLYGRGKGGDGKYNNGCYLQNK